MTPERAIAMLDRQLAKHGQDVTFKRPQDGSLAEKTVKAFVRKAKPDTIAVGATQRTSDVLISPTGLDAWPDGYPDEDDWAEIVGADRSILSAEPIYMVNTLVRINLVVKG